MKLCEVNIAWRGLQANHASLTKCGA
jgi:hypothetical protein